MSEPLQGEYFDSVPETVGIRAQSPLHQYGPRAQPEAGVLLRERRFRGHLHLRGRPKDTGLAEAVASQLSLELPEHPLTLACSESFSLQWLSPDEWLLVTPLGDAFRIAQGLRAACTGWVSVVDVSGGQTLVELSGAQARDVLMKSTPYDVDDRTFPPGKAVTTVFAKTLAGIRRPDTERWELVLRRSYADYLWRWLLDAGAEYGVSVLPPD